MAICKRIKTWEKINSKIVGINLKRKSLAFAIFAVFTILLSGRVLSVSIGTAPGAMNIGTLERDGKYSVDFYLLTNANNPILTSLSYREPKLNLYYENHTGRYRFIPSLASEEDTSKWIKFPKKEIVVDPDETSIVRYPGGVINANQQATFYLNVPEDAESGYHTFEVSLNPSISGSGGGTGVATIGVTRPIFIFRVPGNVERDGKIDGLAGSREAGKARIDVLFRNTGNVTVSARVSKLKIYNETGYYKRTLSSGRVKVPPKSTKVIKTYWLDNNRDEQKKRRVVATVDYLTGKVTKEGMVTIPKKRVVTGKVTEKPEEGFPLWMVVIIVGFAALIMYYWWF